MMPDAPVSVTPWSKQATKNYEAVSVEMVALCELELTLLLLTRKSGMTMGIHLTPAGVEQLARQLLQIQKRFQEYRKETQCGLKR
jgi:hypothetical protein